MEKYHIPSFHLGFCELHRSRRLYCRQLPPDWTCESCPRIFFKVPSMMLAQMKRVKELFWVNLLVPLKRVSTGIEVGIPLTHQLMDAVCEKLFELLVGPLCCCRLDIFI
jgi:hypothetical protein